MPSPDSRTTARILGYSLVLAVILLLFFLASFFLREAFHTGRTIRVHFPEIATLSAGDPVVEAGVTVGTVHDITLEDGIPVAELRLFHHGFLPDDTRFVNFSHSLMGARKVWILPGLSTRPLDESALQPGDFAPGLPETLHKVRALVEKVRYLQQEVDRFQDAGDSLSGALALNRNLEETLRILASLSSSLENAAAALQSGLAAATSAGDRVSSGLRAAGPVLDSAYEDAVHALARLEAGATRLAGGLAVTESLLAAAGDTTGAASALSSQALYENLLKSVDVLDKTTRVLRLEGLGDDMKIKPRLRSKED